MVRSAKRRPRRLSGLTLVEMLIVLVLAVVLITVVLAVIWGGDARKVRTEAQRMAAYFQSAAAEAVMRDGPARVQVAIAEASYHRQVAELSAKVGVPNWSDDENAKKESVKKPVELRELMLPIAGSMKAGTGWVAWNGRKTDGGVAVLGLNEAVYSVVVDPNSGEIRIEKGRVEIPGLMDAPKRKPVKKPLMPLESMGDFSPAEVAQAAKDLRKALPKPGPDDSSRNEGEGGADGDSPEPDDEEEPDDEDPEDDTPDDPEPGDSPPALPPEEPEPEPEEEEEDIGCGPLMDQVEGRCVPRGGAGGETGAVYLGLSVNEFEWLAPEFALPSNIELDEDPQSQVEEAIATGNSIVVEFEVNLETGEPSAYFGQASLRSGAEPAWPASMADAFGEPPSYPKWEPVERLGVTRLVRDEGAEQLNDDGSSRWRFLEDRANFFVNLGKCSIMLPLRRLDLRIVVADGRFSGAEYQLDAVLRRSDMGSIVIPVDDAPSPITLDRFFRASDMVADANGDGVPDGWAFRARGTMAGAALRPQLRTFEGPPSPDLNLCE